MSKFTEIATKITDIKANLSTAITSKGVETSPSDTFANMISNISLISGTSTGEADLTKVAEYQFTSDISFLRYVCSNSKYIFIYVTNNIFCFDKSFNYQWKVTDTTYLTMPMVRIPDFFYADEQYVYLYSLSKYVKVNIETKAFEDRKSSTYGAEFKFSTLTSAEEITITLNGTSGIYAGSKTIGSSSSSLSIYNFNASYNRGSRITANGQNGFFVKRFKDQEKMFFYSFKNSSSSVLSNICYYFFGSFSFTTQTTMNYTDPYTAKLPLNVYNVYELGDSNMAVVSDGYIAVKTINASSILPKTTYNVQLPMELYSYSSDIVVTQDGYLYVMDVNRKLVIYKLSDEIINGVFE